MRISSATGRRERRWAPSRVRATVACTGTLLAAVALMTRSAIADTPKSLTLTTHSASTSTNNLAGYFAATAKCGANEHVVSGGFNISHKGGNEGAAVISRAVKSDRWTVQLFSETSETLTTYAYCAPNGQLSISKHEHQVAAG